jgi:hypothetical protein
MDNGRKEIVMDAANDIRLTPGPAFTPRHEEIELLAFELWQERGAPVGTPEIDWFRAEEKLKRGGDDEGPALSAVAKKIGAALGSVAAVGTSDH